MGYTFISYSRRQLYFAEGLSLLLEKQGIDIWFDLQQLEAGTDWSEKLKDGMENADRMILVVSAASLESPYTRVEWEPHLEKGKPLVLAISEQVDLPEKLRGLPILDFTTHFDEKAAQLTTFLKEGSTPPDDPLPQKTG